MSAKGKHLFRVGLAVACLVGAILACGPTPAAGAVSVTITSPGDGGAVVLGQAVMIDSTVTAAAGVSRVDLTVGGQVARHDAPPSGNPTTFRVSQPWTPETEGQATISVVGYDVNGASGQAMIALQVVASGGVVPTDGPGTVVPPEPTETPPPPVTTEAGCTLDSKYVMDVTIPDGTVMSPGAGFVKTWRVRNSGTCDWDAGFQLIFVGGAQMGGPPSVPLPAVPAGGQTDVSVSLTAPATYGTHKGTWRIRSDEGTVFGTNLTVLIEVPAPATGTPLPTDVPTVGPLPNLETYAFFTDPSTVVAGIDFGVTVTVANFTNVPVANFTVHVLLMDPGESCLGGGSGTLLLDRQASIAAQQFATVGATARIDAAGQHTLCLRIDPSDAVEELYEDDNDMQLTFNVSAAPGADFKIHGHTFHDCSGQTHATFLIENTGDLPFEWARLRLEDLDDTLAVFPESDRPFKSTPTGCGFASEGETLGVGATGYIGWAIDFMTSGNSARATITLCTENGGGGVCEERTLDFTVP
ncbi:MAG: hypothetical protein JW918_08135 [Anaerolineae bacterium]|nr:hypothetical protein [Anaerolineae bacterium]